MAKLTFWTYITLLVYCSLLPLQFQGIFVLDFNLNPPTSDLTVNVFLYFLVPILASLCLWKPSDTFVLLVFPLICCIEFLQGFIVTRVSSILDVGLNVFGYFLGALGVFLLKPTLSRFYRQRVLMTLKACLDALDRRVSIDRISVINPLLLLWSLLVVNLYCTPLPLPNAFNGANFSRGLDLFLGLPFALHQSSDYFVSLFLICIDLFIFAIPGGLIAVLLRYQASDTRILYLLYPMLVGFLVEITQMFMSTRSPDITDVFIYSIGTLWAYLLVGSQLRLTDKVLFIRR